MSYEKIKAIVKYAKKSESLQDLINKLGKDKAFYYGKNRDKVMIKRQRLQYIKKCKKLGLLDEDYRLTDLGKRALLNFDETLAEIILNLKFNERDFRSLLLEALSEIKIPTAEEIQEKLRDLGVKMSLPELRSYLNILAKCGIIKKNRKYTYTFKELNLDEFKNLLYLEYNKIEKDATGQIWFEKFKEDFIKKYNLATNKFDELFNKLRKEYPGLIGLQKSRSKTWFYFRE